MARSAVYVRLKKLQESLDDRNEAVQLDPKNPEVYVARGGSYHLMGQHDKGFEDRSKAIGLAPGLALGWTARGDAYFLLGRWDEALADLEQAVKLDPKNQETRQLMLMAKSKVDEKIKVQKAKEGTPDTESITLPTSTGVVPLNAAAGSSPPVSAEPVVASIMPAIAPFGAAPKAAKTPSAPPGRKAGNPAAEYQQQGRKLIQEEKFAEAIEPLTEAVKLDPFLATTFNARGYAYHRIKKYAEAIADFDTAIKLNPAYANAYTNRSAAKRATGDKAGAEMDVAKARELLKAAK
jgi:tetratricopeptide (TPR) repeat protein